MFVKRRRVRLAVLSLLSFALLAGCSTDETGSDNKAQVASVGTDAATTDAPSTAADTTEVADTQPPATESVSTEALTSDAPASDTSISDTSISDTSTDEADGTEPEVSIPRLAATDPTCVALDRVRKMNDQSGALSNDFIGKALGAIGDGDTTKIEVEFEKFLKEFTTLTDKILPDLTGSYAELARLQPQFATDLKKLESVTLDLLAAFKKMKASDLEKMEEFLGGAVPNEELIAAGQATLRIDKFSRAACDIPFANT